MWQATRNLLAVPSLIFLFFLLLSLRVTGFGPLYTVSMIVLFALAYAYLPRNDYRLFVLYFVGFAAFNGLRTTIHQLGIPVNYAYPIEIERTAFGEVPTRMAPGSLLHAGTLHGT